MRRDLVSPEKKSIPRPELSGREIVLFSGLILDNFFNGMSISIVWMKMLQPIVYLDHSSSIF